MFGGCSLVANRIAHYRKQDIATLSGITVNYSVVSLKLEQYQVYELTWPYLKW